MALCCTICGHWSPHSGRDHLGICADCVTANFSQAQPPVDTWDPLPEDDPPLLVPLTQRQRAALEALSEAYHRECTEDDDA
jgi:hypothetical protein